jgi:hypothetical protein
MLMYCRAMRAERLRALDFIGMPHDFLVQFWRGSMMPILELNLERPKPKGISPIAQTDGGKSREKVGMCFAKVIASADPEYPTL